MNKLKIAVIGVGYLGKFHAEKYHDLPDCELVAVVDTDSKVRQEVSERNSTTALGDYKALLGEVDAVSIAVPTSLHYEVAKDFLENSAHVLIEKPITVTTAEADELISLAKHKDKIIQVGHLERFNSAILGLEGILGTPSFIESHRLAPFNPRATDVNVILDLMIHDIDIILNIVKSEVKSIAASGTRVLTDTPDIANVRLEFVNGCVANVTASRVSMKTERKMRIFQDNACISIDFHKKQVNLYTKGTGEMYPGIANIETVENTYEGGDALKAEIMAFVDSIRNNSPVLVSGEDGRRALDMAIKISKILK